MDLKKVKNILKCDRSEAIVLFLGRRKSNRVCKNPLDKLKPFYYGYKGCADILMQYVKAPLDASICVTDDFGLQMIKLLQDKGYKNFTLMVTDDDPELAERFVCYIKRYYFKGELNNIDIKRIEECKGMKFNLIISNPPYQVGNEITRNIIENIDFDEFINLMPLSKYKKDKLYRYVSSKEKSTVWFAKDFQPESGDLIWTSPEICLLSKKPLITCKTFEDFEHKFIYRKELSKYWEEQSRREKTYVDHICICGQRKWSEINSKTSFITGIYTPCNLVNSILNVKKEFDSGYTLDQYFQNDCWASTGKTVKNQGDPRKQYVWNFLKPEKALNEVYVPVNTASNGKNIGEIITTFKTEKEKDNFVKWWYSAELNGNNPRSGLSSILLWGMNKSTSCPFSFIIPRVDWNRSWTDTEILADYGYSPEEIKDILSIDVTDRHTNG